MASASTKNRVLSNFILSSTPSLSLIDFSSLSSKVPRGTSFFRACCNSSSFYLLTSFTLSSNSVNASWSSFSVTKLLRHSAYPSINFSKGQLSSPGYFEIAFTKSLTADSVAVTFLRSCLLISWKFLKSLSISLMRRPKSSRDNFPISFLFNRFSISVTLSLTESVVALV